MGIHFLIKGRLKMVYNKTQKVKDKMEGRRERIVKAAREIFTEDRYRNRYFLFIFYE